MTSIDFKKNYNEELKQFLNTPCGQNFLSVLGAMRPPYEFSVQSHLLAENRGAMRGYELCLRNVLGLSLPYHAANEPEANYGVPNKPSI